MNPAVQADDSDAKDPAFYEGFPNVKESAARFAFRYMNFRCRCGDPAVILK